MGGVLGSELSEGRTGLSKAKRRSEVTELPPGFRQSKSSASPRQHPEALPDKLCRCSSDRSSLQTLAINPD